MLDAFISIYFYNTMRKKVNRQKRMEYLLMRYKKGDVHKLHDRGDTRLGGQPNFNWTVESLPIVNKELKWIWGNPKEE